MDYEVPTLSDAYQDFKTLKGGKLKPGTVADYDKRMKAFEPWHNLPITMIRKQMVTDRFLEMSERSKSSANLNFKVLRSVLSFAQGYYEKPTGEPIIYQNPVDWIAKMKMWHQVEPRTKVILATETSSYLRAVLSDSRETIRDLLLTITFTGLRRNEASSLEWRDIDLSNRVITIRDTKNRSTHQIPIPDFLNLVLNKRHRTRESYQWVFPSPIDNKKAISPYYHRTEAIDKKCGFHVRFHDLRRSWATVAGDLDINPFAIAKVLNHRSFGGVTRRYVNLSLEKLRPIMQQVEDEILRRAGATIRRDSKGRDLKAIPKIHVIDPDNLIHISFVEC